jgi:hypothetical protein
MDIKLWGKNVRHFCFFVGVTTSVSKLCSVGALTCWLILVVNRLLKTTVNLRVPRKHFILKLYHRITAEYFQTELQKIYTSCNL